MIFKDPKTKDDPTIGASDLFLEVTRLGHATTIAVTGTEQWRVRLTSAPRTEKINVVGDMHVRVPRGEDIDKTFADYCVIVGRFYGHMEVKPSTLKDVSLTVNDLQDLTIEPGKPRSDLTIAVPAVVGQLFQGLSGRYGSVDLALGRVSLDLDIDYWFRVDRRIPGPDVFAVHVDRKGVFDQVRMHLYNNKQPTRFVIEIEIFGAGVGQWGWEATPGEAQPPTVNGVSVPGGELGADGARKPAANLIALIDPRREGDSAEDIQEKDAVLAFLAYHVWPYDGEFAGGGDESESGLC
ncbi:hypothetical protein HII36_55025 [Nonomuraea sp. NN258]|uniref:hypothetical protein n=1 Tax=Nonomuraea antri TaxID=2730852 RepID=UPI001568C716|nr:hypothetical protein [Nonomuraea antri]NRQ40863.1 hypothetical protein [Nonomuraea antri]